MFDVSFVLGYFGAVCAYVHSFYYGGVPYPQQYRLIEISFPTSVTVFSEAYFGTRYSTIN
jgi:hypothetical protein